jgi:hypothetical protein
MKKEDILKIEESVFSKVRECIQKFKVPFEEANVSINPLMINRNGGNESYFSEIEIEFWHLSNLIDAISVIIFMQGKLTIKEDELSKWLENEIFEIMEQLNL